MQINESKVPYYAVHADGKICGFFGPFRFLSNFYVVSDESIHFDGLYYPSVENAYQAAKFPIEMRDQFTAITPGKAKQLGKIAPNLDAKKWKKKKYDLMFALNWDKFSKIWAMKEMLLMTHGCHLEERNSWGDTDWGTDVEGKGENNLGKILMSIRERLKVGPDEVF